MNRFDRLIAIYAAGILSVQAQSASRASEISEQLKDVRKPDFTISNPNAIKGAAIAYSANGLLAAAFENAIQIYDLHQEAPGNAKPTHLLSDSSVIHAITFRDSNTLVSLAVGGSVKTWDATSGTMLNQLFLNSGEFAVSALTTGNQPLLATGTSNHVMLWNYETGKFLSTFETTDSTVSTLAFTPDGKLLVVGTRKGVVRVFDVAKRKIARTIDLDSPIRALSANMNCIVLGYSDGTLAQLSFEGQASTHEVSGHNKAVTSVKFGPKGKRFASGSADGTIKIWDADPLKLLASFKVSAAIFSIAFGANGQTLVSSTTNGLINGWHIPHSP